MHIYIYMGAFHGIISYPLLLRGPRKARAPIYICVCSFMATPTPLLLGGLAWYPEECRTLGEHDASPDGRCARPCCRFEVTVLGDAGQKERDETLGVWGGDLGGR